MIQNPNPTDGELWREAFLMALSKQRELGDLPYHIQADHYILDYRLRYPLYVKDVDGAVIRPRDSGSPVKP